MKYLIITCILLILSNQVTHAQNNLTGKITDQDNRPLEGATIFLVELNKGTISDKDGNFELMNLPNGKTKFSFHL